MDSRCGNEITSADLQRHSRIQILCQCGKEIPPAELHAYGRCEDCHVAGKVPGWARKPTPRPFPDARDMGVSDENHRRA